MRFALLLQKEADGLSLSRPADAYRDLPSRRILRRPQDVTVQEAGLRERDAGVPGFPSHPDVDERKAGLPRPGAHEGSHGPAGGGPPRPPQGLPPRGAVGVGPPVVPDPPPGPGLPPELLPHPEDPGP